MGGEVKWIENEIDDEFIRRFILATATPYQEKMINVLKILKHEPFLTNHQIRQRTGMSKATMFKIKSDLRRIIKFTLNYEIQAKEDFKSQQRTHI